jgi:hypothetical protein
MWALRLTINLFSKEEKMQRQKLLLGTLGILLASLIAFTGCDDVLAEIQKGLDAAEPAASKTKLPSIAAGDNGISVSVGVGLSVDKKTFAEVVAQMDADAKAGTQSETYTLPGGGSGDQNPYTDDLMLIPGDTCPATVTIDGGIGGWVVTGNGNRITIGSGVTLTLKNITFKKLPFSVEAGGTLVLDTGAVVRENKGTGVNVSGTLNMRTGSSVTQNRDTGIVLEANSYFTMNGGEIAWNTGTGGSYFDDGGGVAVQGVGVAFTMNAGSIHDNAGLLFGGGIFVSEYANTCTLNLTGGEIYNNSAGYDGGGVWIYHDLTVTFTMSGGKIRDNQATYNGAGVYILSGNTFNMTGGEITGNSAGGVYLDGGTLEGNPQIGGTDPGPGRGWIHGNTPYDVSK